MDTMLAGLVMTHKLHFRLKNLGELSSSAFLDPHLSVNTGKPFKHFEFIENRITQFSNLWDCGEVIFYIVSSLPIRSVICVFSFQPEKLA